jgi:benzoylformate decarboxylase
VMNNGGYAVMDQLAELHGAPGAWPGLDPLDLATVAAGLGCASVRVATHAELIDTLDEAVSNLRERTEPLLIDVRVSSS